MSKWDGRDRTLWFVIQRQLLIALYAFHPSLPSSNFMGSLYWCLRITYIRCSSPHAVDLILLWKLPHNLSSVDEQIDIPLLF